MVNEIKGFISYVSAQSERNWLKKVKLFREAAEYSKSIRLFKNYHEAIGWAKIWESNDPLIDIDRSIYLLKEAKKHFEKAENPKGLHNASGLLFLLKAIKEGIVLGNNDKFVENIILQEVTIQGISI